MPTAMQSLAATEQDGYVMSKKVITKPEAIAAYRKAISGTTIYRHASDYMRVKISCLSSSFLFVVVRLVYYYFFFFNNKVSKVEDVLQIW